MIEKSKGQRGRRGEVPVLLLTPNEKPVVTARGRKKRIKGEAIQ